jgi:hypothetical protein
MAAVPFQYVQRSAAINKLAGIKIYSRLQPYHPSGLCISQPCIYHFIPCSQSSAYEGEAAVISFH